MDYLVINFGKVYTLSVVSHLLFLPWLLLVMTVGVV